MRIDWPALWAGVIVAVVICVPAALIGQALDDNSANEDPSGAALLLVFVVLAGLVIGAAIAAQRQDVGAPLVHGIAAALVSFALVQGVGILRQFAVSEDISWGGILSSALLSMVAGSVGGLIGARLAASRGPGAVSILVVDVGTSGVRAAIVRPDATVEHSHYRQVLPSSPSPGLVEFDAVVMADAALEVASAALGAGGPVEAVGIANQRASTIVWDRTTGQPVGPGVGWQDLRTAGTCLVLAAEGTKFAPNQSATKLAFLLDMVDPDRTREDLCFGTVDTWIAWTLSGGSVHVTDQSNAGVTGLVHHDGSGWDDHVLELLRIPRSVLPTIVDSTGVVGEATALEGAPPIAGIAGDQQSSLIGQGCVRRGLAKATFGTGGMLDLCLDGERPSFDRRGPAGCFPIAAWQRDGEITWGVEAIMLTAGTNVEWLRDDLGVIATVGGVTRRRVPVHRCRWRRVRPRVARSRHARAGTTEPAPVSSA